MYQTCLELNTGSHAVLIYNKQECYNKHQTINLSIYYKHLFFIKSLMTWISSSLPFRGNGTNKECQLVRVMRAVLIAVLRVIYMYIYMYLKYSKNSINWTLKKIQSGKPSSMQYLVYPECIGWQLKMDEWDRYIMRHLCIRERRKKDGLIIICSSSNYVNSQKEVHCVSKNMN